MEQNNINDILGLDKTISQSKIKASNNISRYPALRSIAAIYKILAWVVGSASLLISIYFLSEHNQTIFAIITLVVGGLLALGLAAISESIQVFVDIEHNTRKASEK